MADSAIVPLSPAQLRIFQALVRDRDTANMHIALLAKGIALGAYPEEAIDRLDVTDNGIMVTLHV